MLTGENTLVRIDWLTVILFVLLTGFGWLNLFSATYDEGLPVSLFSFASRYSKQFYYILAALVIAFLVMITDGKVWGAFAYLVYGLTVGLSILVLFIGREINGARSWIILGPVSFQPAEFMKVGMALLLAKLLSTKGQLWQFLNEAKAYYRAELLQSPENSHEAILSLSSMRRGIKSPVGLQTTLLMKLK